MQWLFVTTDHDLHNIKIERFSGHLASQPVAKFSPLLLTFIMNEDDRLKGDDEAFRQEFLEQMSGLLGFGAPGSQVEPPRVNPSDQPYLVKAEIANLRSLVDRYRAFVLEITGEQKTKDPHL